MTVRWALSCVVVACLLAGCVSSTTDPITTEEGRHKARDAYIQLGIGYLQQGMTARAKIPLRKALELDPKSADAHTALALVFQAEMEVQLADEEYRKALSYQRGARVLNNYGSFLYEQGRYPEALKLFQDASEDALYPERGRVFENLGLTALKLGQPTMAAEYFNRALRLDSQLGRSLLELAILSYSAQQYVPAKQYYERFSASSEQTARSLLLGIQLADIFQERDKGASLALRLKRLYPVSPEYKTYLSEHP